MKKLLLLAGAVAALFAAPAMAADLARPPVYRAPAVVPVPYYSWTGCYAGANGGGIWTTRDWSDSTGLFGFGTFGNTSANGGLGGVQVGCDYQVVHWVIGVAGDWDWTSANGSTANTVLPFFNDQSNIKSLASITIRTGYAWDRFLLYVKGGGAWLRSDDSLQFTGATLATVSQTRNGWTIGVGGEWALLNWLSAFVEYDYYNFKNSNNNNDSFACLAAACPATFINANVNATANVVKAGLNFRFGPGARW
jgi:outer membrane immunogenic protein